MSVLWRYARRAWPGLWLVVAALLWGAPAAVASDTFRAPLGASPSGQRLALVLPLEVDAVGLHRFAATVSTPGSPLYGRYEPLPVLSRRFGAAPGIRRQIVGYLHAHHASAVKVDSLGLFAEATIDAGVAARLFSTSLMRFRSEDGSIYTAPTTLPRIPKALRRVITGVIGLDTRPIRTRPQAVQQASSAAPRTGTPPGCAAGQAAGETNSDPTTAGFTPNQYLTAYGLSALQNQGNLGQGERVALIEDSGFNYGDVVAFTQCFGLPTPNVNVFHVNDAQPGPGLESTLDLEVLDAAAPRLKAIDVYEANSDAASVLITLAGPLENPHFPIPPQVMSVSLGLCEADMLEGVGASELLDTQQVLWDAAASGITVLAASGDSGSSGCLGLSGTPKHELAVDYPASEPYVTAVGGTSLSLTQGNQISDQLVWSDPSRLFASGGGISNLNTRPPFQNGVVQSRDRALPDVSMLAGAPGYAIYCTAASCLGPGQPGPWVAGGGTSAAAPLLAGGIALADQALRRQQRAFLGQINPLLYAIGKSSLRTSVFSDVTQGSNDLGASLPAGGGKALGCCTAAVGYDAASGWGSVDVAALEQEALRLLPKLGADSVLTLPPHQQPVRTRRIELRLTCNYACFGGIGASIAISHGKSFFVDVFANLHAGGSEVFAIKLSRAQQRTLRAALASRRKIVATITGIIEYPTIEYITPRGPIPETKVPLQLTIRS